MDIQIASNFERYLFYLFDRDSEKLQQALKEFSANGRLQVGEKEFARVKEEFFSARADNLTTLEVIRKAYKNHDYILDPHTAAGVHAARCYIHEVDAEAAIVCLATAHPAKFPDAVKQAIGSYPPVPPPLRELADRPTPMTVLPASTAAVKEFIVSQLEKA
jgi:threonine synthase